MFTRLLKLSCEHYITTITLTSTVGFAIGFGHGTHDAYKNRQIRNEWTRMGRIANHSANIIGASISGTVLGLAAGIVSPLVVGITPVAGAAFVLGTTIEIVCRDPPGQEKSDRSS